MNGLRQFATPRQIEYLDAIEKYGSQSAAARALGVAKSTVQESMKGLRSRAAVQGWCPESDMTKPVPSPFVVKGTSTLYDAGGKPKLQWVKTRLDGEIQQAAMLAAVDAMAADIVKPDAIKAPEHCDADLCNLYTLTDCHVGMRSWRHETGEDWDLEIAERVLTSAFDYMISASPKAETAVVCQLGDFLHFDSLTPVTPTHGFILDGDGRYAKVIKVAVRILRYIIDTALAKHHKVVVLMAEGNHDMASSVWLRHLFGLLYENEPRVQVIDSEMPYYAYQHGKTMLAFHHGHLKKNEALPLLFAAQFPKVWGNTTKRYCHTGHRHHTQETEHSGMTVFQHPTIAARDSHASRGGWIADRTITAITYHSEFGQSARVTACADMFKE